MQIIITGGAGFLGQELVKQLLKSNLAFSEILLADIVLPKNPTNDNRIISSQIDISDQKSADQLISKSTIIVFHLAAIVSSHAEKDFDLGWKINVDGTRFLLEACRKINNKIRFVFASSCAVFGGQLPDIVQDNTALQPQGSYGSQKAIGELLVNDYARKGFINGISLRLPTVCIRPGKPNLAASSFVSGIIREPLNEEEAICPVPKELAVWISSPNTIIQNFIHAANILENENLNWRVVNLPGIKITVEEMLNALENKTNKQTINLVKFEENPAIQALVNTWPVEIDNTNAIHLGFQVDDNFETFIELYLNRK